MAIFSKIFRFLVLVQNVLKWPPNGLKRCKTHFYDILTRFWPLLAGSTRLLGALHAILGPQKGPKNAPKMAKMVILVPQSGPNLTKEVKAAFV